MGITQLSLNYSAATELFYIWVPRDPLGEIPWVGYLGVGYHGGTDGTLGPMGPWDRWDLGTDGTWASGTLGLKDPGPQGPPIINLIGPGQNGKFRKRGPIPVPDPRLPGPGAGYPATRARCRISSCRAGNSYPGPDPRLPGPGAGYPATGPAKKNQKNRKKKIIIFSL